MPKKLKTYSTCNGPDETVPFSRIGGITGVLIAGYFGGVADKVLSAAVGGTLLIVFIAFAGWGAICAVAPFAILMAIEIKWWYYNRRLLCVGDDRCVIGEVMARPEVATDGDRKLNLILAPFAKEEVWLLLALHLDRNRTILADPANFPSTFFDSVPELPQLQELMSVDASALRGYMNKLSGKVSGEDSNIYNQMTIGVVDTLLDPARSFQGRYYRKDPTQISVLTFDAIPVDFDVPPSGSWQLPGAIVSKTFTNPVTQASGRFLNPMFRYAADHLVPYLHCEIEGHNIAILMDDVIVAASGILFGCAFFGPLGGAIAGFLAWLLKKFFDWATGNDGDAAEPGVDWDDPDLEAPTVFGERGSTVAVYGDWIMDTEHEQYFEIHPVRAYYVLSSEQQLGTSFNNTMVNAKSAQDICHRIATAENLELDPEITVEATAALAYGLETRYGGGGEPPEIK